MCVFLFSVISPRPGSCRSDEPTIVTRPRGHLASIVTTETGCGSVDSPWEVRLAAGQRIRVYLLDYGYGVPHNGSDVSVFWQRSHQWGSFEWDQGVPSHGQLDCLLTRLSRLIPMKTSKMHITDPLWRKSIGHMWFPLTQGRVMRRVFEWHGVIMFRSNLKFVWIMFLCMNSRGCLDINMSSYQ